MELICIGILAGVVITLIAVGLINVDEMRVRKQDERMVKSKLYDSADSDVLCDSPSNNHDSTMGDIHEPKCSRQDMEMDTEEIKEVLYTMRIGTTGTERRVLSICISLIEKLEEILDDDLK